MSGNDSLMMGIVGALSLYIGISQINTDVNAPLVPIVFIVFGLIALYRAIK